MGKRKGKAMHVEQCERGEKRRKEPSDWRTVTRRDGEKQRKRSGTPCKRNGFKKREK
jgi:hypothetical protein